MDKPSIIFFICIITLILIVPSIIVMPFSNQSKVFTKSSKESSKTTQPVFEQQEKNNFDVAVYRTGEDQIESVPIEEYVVGVVASEMPVTFEIEALKAQSLAARTFLVHRMVSNYVYEGIPDDAHISDNHLIHQVYKSIEELEQQWGERNQSNIEKIKDAVNATKGEIITYENKPIDPSFFSTSNGYTENSEDFWSSKLPYLRSVPSPWDKDSPKFKGEKILTIQQVGKALGVQLNPNGKVIGNKTLTKSNRVATILIGGKEFTGPEIKKALNLPSSDFDIKQEDGKLIITTLGNGHGVGMSQYGANGMAKEGKSYEEIVKYFYQGVEISSIEPYLNKGIMKK
ncbi:stage II sporulation protein D [Metabacillus malikii]|uniref:Stage II sporulation protein D n=1 Tax=Metabacillus malikii TaxID=1504265 RepID=A0ABT9Z9U3_9BACI|nr:stage II sporulation protein D [Metabacillus malikii]MDQ0229030.1 stage II sporulation protein D [Metabacillus malikii]